MHPSFLTALKATPSIFQPVLSRIHAAIYQLSDQFYADTLPYALSLLTRRGGSCPSEAYSARCALGYPWRRWTPVSEDIHQGFGTQAIDLRGAVIYGQGWLSSVRPDLAPYLATRHAS